MNIDWGLMITIFLAVILAEFFSKALFHNNPGNPVSETVEKATSTPTAPTVVYSNPIDEYLRKTYPNAT